MVSQTVESFCFVEIKIRSVYLGLEFQESLHLFHLWKRISDQLIPVHDVDAVQGEVLEPVLHVDVVQASVKCLVSQVDLAILHKNRLDGLVVLVLLEAVVKDLGVVRQHPLGGVSEDEQQLDVRVHLMDAFRDLAGGEVGRCLFHRQLVWKGVRHLAEVPRQPLLEMTLPVKKVDFVLSSRYSSVQTEHLDQRPRAPLPHADDDNLRELLVGPIRVSSGRG